MYEHACSKRQACLTIQGGEYVLIVQVSLSHIMQDSFALIATADNIKYKRTKKERMKR